MGWRSRECGIACAILSSLVPLSMVHGDTVSASYVPNALTISPFVPGQSFNPNWGFTTQWREVTTNDPPPNVRGSLPPRAPGFGTAAGEGNDSAYFVFTGDNFQPEFSQFVIASPQTITLKNLVATVPPAVPPPPGPSFPVPRPLMLQANFVFANGNGTNVLSSQVGAPATSAVIIQQDGNLFLGQGGNNTIELQTDLVVFVGTREPSGPPGGTSVSASFNVNSSVIGNHNLTLVGPANSNLQAIGPGGRQQGGEPNSPATVRFFSPNSYTGLTTINGGSLRLFSVPGGAIPGDLLITNNGFLRADTFQSQQFNPNATVTVRQGSYLDFGRGGGNDPVQTIRNLTVERGGIVSGRGLAVNGRNSIHLDDGTVAVDALFFPNGMTIQARSGSIIQNTVMTSAGNPIVIDLESDTTKFHGFDLELLNVTSLDTITVTGNGVLALAGQDVLTLNESPDSHVTIEFGLTKNDVIRFNQAVFTNYCGDTIDGFGRLIIRPLNATTVGTLINEGMIRPGDREAGTLTLEANLVQRPSATALFTVQRSTASQLIVREGGVTLDGRLIVQGCEEDLPLGCALTLIDNCCGQGIQGNFRCFTDQLCSNIMGTPFLSADQHRFLLGIGASPQAEMGAALQTLNFGVTQETLFAAQRTWEIRPWENIEKRDPATLYIAPLGSWGSQDNHCSQRGFDFHSYGGLIGGDYAFERVGVGAFIGYDHYKGDINCDFGDFRIGSLFGQLYGTFIPAPDRNFFIDLTLGGMRNWFTLNRQAFCGTAQGTPNGWTYDGYVGVGYNLSTKKEWRLTPIVGIQYIHSRVNAFNESGAGAEDLNVDDFKQHFLRSWVGATFGGKIQRNTIIWIPQVHAYWQHEFARTSRCLAVSNPCLNTCKNLGVFTGGRNWGIAGGDLGVQFGEWQVTGAYDYFWGSGASVNNVYAQVAYHF
jgi:autotransporter-associated beta strand protein